MTQHAPTALPAQGALPPGWKFHPLAELLTALETGSRPPGGAVGIDSGVPSLSAEHMTNEGTFDFSTLRYVPRSFFETMPRGHIARHDILVVKDGATTGKCAFVDDAFPFAEAAVNEHVFLCRPNPGLVEPYFLFLWLWGPPGFTAMRSHFQGAAIGGINRTFAKSTLVPLPPLPEQRRIAAKLRQQLAHVDRAVVSTRARLAEVRALFPSLLRARFQSPDIQSAARVTMAQLSSLIIDGPHVTPAYVPSGIPFVTVKNIVSRRLDFSSTSFVTREDYDTFSRRGRPEIGDILYSKDGTLGVPCLVDDAREFSFFVSVALIKLLRDRAHPSYVAFALDSPDVLEQVDRLAAGAGLKHMVLKSIRSLRIPIPPLEVQKSIATLLQQQLADVERGAAAAKGAVDAAERLAHALLRDAFSGRL